MALVYEQDEVVREVIQQRHRRRARLAPGDHAGIILDPAAVAQLLHHFHIKLRALGDTLRLKQLVVFAEGRHTLLHLAADLSDGARHLLLGGNIVARGIDRGVVEHARRHSRNGIDLRNAVDLITEEFHAQRLARPVGGIDLHRVSADAEGVSGKVHIVALVADGGQRAQQLVAAARLPLPQGDDHALVVDRVAQTVDTADRRNDDHIPPLKERRGRGVPQTLDLIVDGGVFFYVGIRVGDIRLGLIVVIIGYEVLHSVFGEELLELAAKLCGEGLVVRQHQGGAVELRDDVCHREGLAGACHAQQHLLPDPVFQTIRQLADRLGLIARRLVIRM